MIKKLCVAVVMMIMALSLNPAQIKAIPKDPKVATIEGLKIFVIYSL